MANTYSIINDRYIQSVESLAVADSAGANVVTVNGAALHRFMNVSGNIIPYHATIVADASHGIPAL